MPKCAWLTALLACLLGATPALAHPITVDGDPADWDAAGWAMDAPGAANLGHVARDSSARGQYVWLDTAGDERTDFTGGGPDARVDITSLRITSDATYLYLLVGVTDVELAAGDGAVQVRVGIDRDYTVGQGNTALGQEAHLHTATAAVAAWEYLVLSRFGSGADPAVYTTAWALQTVNEGDPAPAGSLSNANDVMEMRIPWAVIGGAPTAALTFTVAALRANDTDGAWQVGDGAASATLDVVSNYGDPGSAANSWDGELSDGVVDYHFQVWFHLDADTEPAPPVLLSELLYRPGGGETAWVELANPGAAAVSLEGFKVGDEETPDGDEGLEGFPAGASLAAGARASVADSATAFAATYGSAPDFEWGDTDGAVTEMVPYTAWTGGAAGSVSFTEAGDELILVDPFNTIVDSLSYGTGALPGVKKHPGGVAAGWSLDRTLAGMVDTNAANNDFAAEPFPNPGALCDPCDAARLGVVATGDGPQGNASTYIIGDVVSGTWRACGGVPVQSVSFDFSQLGGGTTAGADGDSDGLWEASSAAIAAGALDTDIAHLIVDVTYCTDAACSATATCSDVTETADRSVDNELPPTDLGVWVIESRSQVGGSGSGASIDGQRVLLVDEDIYVQFTPDVGSSASSDVVAGSVEVNLGGIYPMGDNPWRTLSEAGGVFTLTFPDGAGGMQVLAIDELSESLAIRLTDDAGNQVEGRTNDVPEANGGTFPLDLWPPPLTHSPGDASHQEQIVVDISPAGPGGEARVGSVVRLAYDARDYVRGLDGGGDLLPENDDIAIVQGVRVDMDYTDGDDDYRGWYGPSDGVGTDAGGACDVAADDHIYTYCLTVPAPGGGEEIDDGTCPGGDTCGRLMRVQVRDDAGNVAGWDVVDQGSGAYRYFSLDNVAPVVGAANTEVTTSPTGTASTYKVADQLGLRHTRSATDVVQASFDFRPAGGSQVADNSADGSGRFAAQIDLTEDGATDTNSAELVVTATDDAGNSASYTLPALKVDREAPTAGAGNTEITSSPTGTDSTYKVGDTLAARHTRSHADVAEASFDFSAAGGGTVVDDSADGSGRFVADLALTADGVTDAAGAQVAVTVTDDAGNSASYSVAGVKVDRIPPVVDAGRVDILSSPTGSASTYKVGDDIQIRYQRSAADVVSTSFDYSEAGGGVLVDDSANGSGYFRQDLGLSDDSATDTACANVGLQATDDAGNTSAAYETACLKVDRWAPHPQGAGGIQMRTDVGAADVINAGDTVRFRSSSLALEDGDPDGGSAEWRADLSGLNPAAGSVAPQGDVEVLDLGGAGIQSAAHVFAVAVTDDAGNTGAAAIAAQDVDNRPTTIEVGDDLNAGEGQDVAFSATPTDADGDETYAWDFGDGNTASGRTPSHAYATEGSYNVTCTVTDHGGHERSDSLDVDVTNAPPVITPADGYSRAENQALTNVSLATFTDSGTVDLHGTAQGTAVDWGDGDNPGSDWSSAGLTITEPDGDTPGEVEGSHTYTQNGSYQVSVRVCDDGDANQCATATFTVAVSNAAPELSAAAAPAAITEDGGYSDQRLVTYTDAGPDDGHQPGDSFGGGTAVNWGDGSGWTAAGLTVVEPAGATPGRLEGTHQYLQDGSYDVRVRVCDDAACTEGAAYTVTVNNSTPAVTPSMGVSLQENGELDRVLATYTDPGTLDSHQPGDSFGEGTAVDWGDGSDWTAVGLAVAEPDGDTPGSLEASHRYLQDGNYTVRVRVCDDDACQTRSFAVEVTNVAPAVTPAATQTQPENHVFAGLTLATYTDPGTQDGHQPNDSFGDGTAVDWGDGDSPGSDWTAAGLTVTEPDGQNPGAVRGGHTYTQDGSYTVRVRVCDDDTCETEQFTVNITNAAPEVTMPAIEDVDENHLFDDYQLATYTDEGPDDTHDPGFGAGTAVHWGEPGGDFTTNGISITEPDGDNAGRVEGTHRYERDGTYTVQVRVCDDDQCVTTQRQVTVLNVAPSVTPAGAQTRNEHGSLTNFQLATYTDPGRHDLHTPAESHAPGTAVDWGDGDDPGSDWTSDGLTVREPAAGGTVEGSHQYLQDGVYTVRVRVCDDDECSQNSFRVTVNNVVPTVSAAGNQEVDEHHRFDNLQLATFTDPGTLDSHQPGESFGGGTAVDWGDGNDPGNDWSSANLTVVEPDGGTPGRLTGTHRYLQDGVYTVSVRVCDDDVCRTQTFTVTVLNVAPVLSAAGQQNLQENGRLNNVTLATFTDTGTQDLHPLGALNGTAVDWGDGDGSLGVEGIRVDENGGSGSVVGSHQYLQDGTYNVRVQVCDEHPADCRTTSFNVVVANVAPSITPAADQQVEENHRFPNDFLLATFTDPGTLDGHQPNQSFGDGSAVDWGDGDDPGNDWVSNGITFTEPSGGNPGEVSGGHRYRQAGSYTVRVRVCDDDVCTGSSFEVVVANVPPTVTAADDQRVDEFHNFQNFEVATFVDAGADDIHWPGTAPGTAVDWGEGDGFSTDTLALVEPAGGNPGSLRGSHQYLQDGTYDVQVRICDDAVCVTEQFQVQVDNLQPVLTPNIGRQGDDVEGSPVVEAGQNYLRLGTFVDRGVLDTFTAQVSWGDESGARSFADAEVVAPARGNPPDPGAVGELRAQHTFCQDGTYEVVVRIWDDAMQAAGDDPVEGRFTVVVDNVAPSFGQADMLVGGGEPPEPEDGSARYLIVEGTQVAFVLAASDPGCDDQGLTYRWQFGDATADSVEEDPGHLYDDNCLQNEHEERCRYQVTVTVTDSDGARDVRQFHVAVDNVAPTVDQPVVVRGTDEGESVRFRTFASDPSVRDMGEFYFCWDFDAAIDDDGDRVPDNDCQQNTSRGRVSQGRVRSQVDWTYDDDHHGRHKDRGLEEERYTVRVWVRDMDGGEHSESLPVSIDNVSPEAEAGGYQELVGWEDPDARDDDLEANGDPIIDAAGNQIVAEGYVRGVRCYPTQVALLGGGTDVALDDLSHGFYYRWDYGDGDFAPREDDYDPTELYCFVGDHWRQASEGACLGQELFLYTGTGAGVEGTDWVRAARLVHTYGDNIAVDDEGRIILDAGEPEEFSPYAATVQIRDKDGAETVDTLSVSLQNVPPLPRVAVVQPNGFKDLGVFKLKASEATEGMPGDPCTPSGPSDEQCIATFTIPLRSDVDFTAVDSCDPGRVDTVNLEYAWYFVETHEREVGMIWRRQFGTQGTKQGSLLVNDPQEASSQAFFQVVVSQECDDLPPAALEVLGGQEHPEGDPVTIRGSVPDHPVNEVVTVLAFNFDDGTQLTCAPDPGTYECEVTTTFADNGPVQVQLSAYNDQGCQYQAAAGFGITNVRPSLLEGEPHLVSEQVVEGSPFNLGVQFRDPGQDEHTVAWDCDNDGFFERLEAAGRCTLCTEGDHVVAVRVEDDDGGSVTGTVTVTVSNAPPAAQTTPLVENVFEGNPVQLFASATDPGCDPGDSDFSYIWRFWAPGSDLDNDPPLLQSVEQSPNLVFPDDGAHDGRLVAIDGGGAGLASGPASVRVTVSNLPPFGVLCFEREGEPVEDAASLRPNPDALDELPPECRRGQLQSPELVELSFVALSNDPGPVDADNLSFAWDFGDGEQVDFAGPGENRRVTHVFEQQGNYDVRVTVRDPQGATHTDSLTVGVAAEPPVCEQVTVSAQASECAPLLVQVQAHSPAGEGVPLDYVFTWGDNSATVRSEQPEASHAYAQDGTYDLQVAVVDPDNVRGFCDPARVVVTNAPPEVELGPGLSATEGSSVRLTALASDCGGDLGLGLQYAWIFGDGDSTAAAPSVSAIDHVYAEPGEYTVTVLVEDDHPLDDGAPLDPDTMPNVDQVLVTVSNQPPALEEQPLQQGDEGALLRFTACCQDPGGLPEAGLEGWAGPLEITWQWGDGAEDSVAAEVRLDDPACLGGAYGIVEHAFPDNREDPYQVQLSCQDPAGGLDVTRVLVRVTNVGPRILFPEQGQWTAEDPAIAVQGEVFTGQFQAEDPGTAERLRWELLTGAEVGMRLDAHSGLLTWQPSEDQVGGRFQLGVRVTDKDGARDQFFGFVRVEVGDTDGDECPDWYEDHFDCLAADDPDDCGLDPDGDGLTCGEEFGRDQTGDFSDPCLSNAPLGPAVLAPTQGEEVSRADPALSVRRATDPDQLASYDVSADLPRLRYVFVVGQHLDEPDHPARRVIASNLPPQLEELDPEALDAVRDCSQLQEEAGDEVRWNAPAHLLADYDNHDLQWRARACDGWAFGPWSDTVDIFFNPVEQEPADPMALQPADGQEEQPLRPVFVLEPTLSEPYPGGVSLQDPDRDEVCYRFVIWQQAQSAAQPFVTPPGEVCGLQPDGSVTYELPARLSLANDTRFCWHGVAVDEHGNESGSSADNCFLVNPDNRPPSSPRLRSPTEPGEPPVGPERVPGDNVFRVQQVDAVELVFSPASDPDGNDLEYIVEWVAQAELDSDPPGFGDGAESAGPLLVAGDDGTHRLNGLEDNTFYYWRVVAREVLRPDSQTLQPAVGLFFTSLQNDLPGEPSPLQPDAPTVQPTLEARCAVDPDHDRLKHVCEIRRGDEAGELVVASGNLTGAPRGEACSLSWQVPEGLLLNNADYCFRCRACDQAGGCTDEEQWGPWSVCRAFRPLGNICPSPPGAVLAPEPRSHHGHTAWPVLEVTNVVDPDANNGHTYTFEVYDTEEIERSEGPVLEVIVQEGPDGSTQADLSLEDVAAIQPAAGQSQVFYWRVRVTDALDTEDGKCDTAGSVSSFFIDGPPVPPGSKDEGCCGHLASSQPPRVGAYAILSMFVLVALAWVRRRR